MTDEAYLNRHRRYEAFEKKQRRREKEKLVHEQYKLRQRLDELRGFDINALTATYVMHSPMRSYNQSEDSSLEPTSGSLGAANGWQSYALGTSDAAPIYMEREHRRVILKSAGWPMRYFASLYELVSAIRDGVKGTIVSFCRKLVGCSLRS